MVFCLLSSLPPRLPLLMNVSIHNVYIHCLISSLAAPKIAPFDFIPSLKSGDRTGVYCQASGSLPIVFEWYKNGVLLKDNDLLKIVKNEEDASSLKFKSISPLDSGNYTCSASNNYGVDRYTATLIIHG